MNAKSRPTAKRRTGRQNRAGVAKASAAKKVLVVDVGGASVKLLARIEFPGVTDAIGEPDAAVRHLDPIFKNARERPHLAETQSNARFVDFASDHVSTHRRPSQR